MIADARIDIDVAPPEAPFRGIEAFRFIDQSIFFGRDGDAMRLFQLVSLYRAVLLYGESGAGKSSLVNARFVPMCLRDGLIPEIVRVRPRLGQELLIERIALSNDARGPYLPSMFVGDDRRLDRVPLSILEARAAIAQAPSERRSVLIFDQFEEFVTLFEDSGDGPAFRQARQAQAAIHDLLIELIQTSGLRVKVLFSFRDDYLGRLMGMFRLAPNLHNQYLRLEPLPIEELPQIVRGPFLENKGAFGGELSEAIAHDLQAQMTQHNPSGVLNLSEVQIVCKRLFELGDPERQLAERKVVGLLGDYLGDRLEDFSEVGRDAAVIVLSRLVTATGTRNVVSEDDLLKPERAISTTALHDALDKLEDDRLVRREARRELFFYEIVSEVLVPSIERERQAQLVHWQEAEKRAQEEEERRVKEVEAARARREAELARRQRLVVIALVVLVAVAALVSVLVVVAFGQAQAASTQAAAAEAAKGEAVRAQVLLQQQTEASATQAAAAREQLNQQEAELEVVRARSGEAQKQADDARLAAAAAADDARAQQEQADSARKQVTDAQEQLAKQQLDLDASRKDAETAQQALDTQRRLVEQARIDATAAQQRANAATIAAQNAQARAEQAGKDAEEQRQQAEAAQADVVQAQEDARVQLEAAQEAAKQALQQYQQQADRLLADAQRNAQTIANATGTDRLVQYSPLSVLTGAAGSITDARIRPDGELIAIVGNDGEARLWNPTATQVLDLKGHTGTVRVARFSRGSQWIVTGGDDHTARVWNSVSGEQRAVLQGHNGAVRAVVMSPDAQLVATGSDDGTVKLWLPDGGPTSATLDIGKAPVTSLAFSKDSDRIAVGSNEDASVWDVTGRRLFRLAADQISDISFSPSGTSILTADRHGTLKLFSNTDGTLVQTLDGHTAAVNSAVFSPDGRTIASASDDHTARLWDAASGTSTVLTGHLGEVRSVAFNADGSLVMTASADTSARIWNVANGEALVEERGHQGAVFTAAFNPDGKSAMTASADGDVRVWSTQGICTGPLVGGFGVLWRSNSVIRSSLGCPDKPEQQGIVGTQYFPNGMLLWWDPNYDLYVFYGQDSGRWEHHVLGGLTDQTANYTCPSGIVPMRGFGAFLNTHEDITIKLGKCPTTIEEGPDQAGGQRGARQLFPNGLMLIMPSTTATGEKRIWTMVNEPGSAASGTFTRSKDSTP